MKIEQKNTHEAKLLIIDQQEEFSLLEGKLIESLDNRYILKPIGAGRDAGVFEYDISEMENFREYLMNRKLSRTEMIGFLAQLKSVIATLEDHMLGDANLLMEPSCVFIDRFSRKVRFLPVCQTGGSFGSRLRPLAEEMFLHADLADTESLRFAASILRTAMKEEVRMHDLMELIENRSLSFLEYPRAQTAAFAQEYRDSACAREPVSFPEDSTGFCPELAGDGEEMTMRLTEDLPGQRYSFPEQENIQEQPPQKEAGVKNFFTGLVEEIREKLNGEE